MMLLACNDYVLVELDDSPKQTDGGLLLPDVAEKQSIVKGKIFACGAKAQHKFDDYGYTYPGTDSQTNDGEKKPKKVGLTNCQDCYVIRDKVVGTVNFKGRELSVYDFDDVVLVVNADIPAPTK